MHTDLPQFTLFANRQRIIKVLGILRVDGTGKHIAKILTALYLLFRNTRFYLLCRILDSLRILVGQTVLRQNSVHLHIVVALLTQNVNNLTHDILRVLRRPLRNFDDSLVARLAALQLLLGYQHIVYENVAFSY